MATEQTISSTTFFIETDIVRCEGEDGWSTTVAGDETLMNCELGYGGHYVRLCQYNGQWGEIRNECGRVIE